MKNLLLILIIFAWGWILVGGIAAILTERENPHD